MSVRAGRQIRFTLWPPPVYALFSSRSTCWLDFCAQRLHDRRSSMPKLLMNSSSISGRPALPTLITSNVEHRKFFAGENFFADNRHWEFHLDGLGTSPRFARRWQPVFRASGMQLPGSRSKPRENPCPRCCPANASPSSGANEINQNLVTVLGESIDLHPDHSLLLQWFDGASMSTSVSTTKLRLRRCSTSSSAMPG